MIKKVLASVFLMLVYLIGVTFLASMIVNIWIKFTFCAVIGFVGGCCLSILLFHKGD